MQSGCADVPGPRRSVVGVQPTVEHSDGIVETVGGPDRYERLPATDSAGAGEGVEGREGELCLRERELSLVPAGGCFLEPPRLLVAGQEGQRRGVGD
jgi:hypothetical protein